MIRHWRKLRRMSQMELAFAAGLSPRHVSFIETGRARPSRASLMAISHALSIPLREQNVVLELAGHARQYLELNYDDPDNHWLRTIVRGLLRRQEPSFAVAVDHRWDIVDANPSARAVLSAFFSAARIPRRKNLLRLFFHPRGLRPRIVNFESLAPRLVRAVETEAALRPHDTALPEMIREFAGYGSESEWSSFFNDTTGGPAPIVVRSSLGDVSLLGVVMAFGNGFEPAMEEVRVETFLAADQESGQRIAQLGGRLDR